MRVSEHANYLLNEYGRLQFDYAAFCKPDGESLRNEARNNLETYIAELEAEVTKCHELQDSYCDRIAELEAAQRWIPVSERLPEPYEKVIALAKDCMNVDWVLPKELRQVGKGAFARLYNVTHWMYAPQPPEVQA